MIRKEAKEKYGKSLCYNIVLDVIESFEIKTCENCKHYLEDVKVCLKHISENGYTYKDFGCNKFEPKDESTYIGLDGKETTKWGM